MVYAIKLGIRQPSLFVGIVQAGNLAQAFHGLALVGARARVGESCLAAKLLSSSVREQSRLLGLELADVTAVVV